MKIILINPYELGRQPFALAEPAAFLGDAGYTVRCLDFSLQTTADGDWEDVSMVAIHLGMHTATRIAIEALPSIREQAPRARLCVYGLYAPANRALFEELGVDAVLGVEAEPALLEVARRIRDGENPLVDETPMPKVRFIVPDRSGLPPLESYASLLLPNGDSKVCGFVEATRGCKHLCRHCPVVPAYNGLFRAVPLEVVLADIEGQVGAGAHHISFGDPDFLNGPTHASRVVTAMHRQFPQLTFDATIKVQHILRHAELLPELAAGGCLFITSAVETPDDKVLALLDKNHSCDDFIEAHRLLRDAGIALAPTFIPFTPWATVDDYIALLRLLCELGLVHSVPPVQLTIRLLVPGGSHLLKIEGFSDMLEPYNNATLGYPWRHSNPVMDALHQDVRRYTEDAEQADTTREDIFKELWRIAHTHAKRSAPSLHLQEDDLPIPRMSEPWYCCAEPTELQLAAALAPAL